MFSFQPAQAEMGLPLQIKLKSPSGTYPTESGVNVKVYVLSPVTNCILREENFSSQNVVNGSLSLRLGVGILGSYDPALTLNQVYNNSAAKSGLSCVDANNNIISISQVYTPSANDHRVVRIITNVSSENIIVNFSMRSVPYAIQAEAVGGKLGADILVQNTATALNQSNLNSLLADSTHFTNLKNFAQTGSVASTGNFTGNLVGDVTGTQGSTSVTRIRGVNVSATAPVSGDILQYNGTQYVPVAIPSAPVSSVAGRTGSVILSNTDISGLGSAAVLNAGTSANNLVQLDSGAKIPAILLPNSVLTSSSSLSGDVTGNISATSVTAVGGKSSSQISAVVDDVTAATATNTAGAIVKRDGTGNVTVNNVSSSNVSTNNVYLFDGTNSIRLKAPAGLAANYILNLPIDAGSSGQFLQTDGSGNLVWSSTTAGLSPANNLSDLVSAPSARVNLGLGDSAVLNVGTAASTVAAGNDSRIVNALQSAAYNVDVASASSCTSSQTTYWNTVTDMWACQNISFPADAVTSVAGRTGVVVLSSADISGLGSAATLTYGTAAGQLVQLDGAARIPASTLPTNALTTSSVFSGDVTGDSSSLSVDRIKGIPVSATAPTAGQALVFNGTEWVATTGFPSFVKKSANQVFSSNALANVTDLSFNVTSGRTYRYKFYVIYSSAITTSGIRLGLTYPAATLATATAQLSAGGDGTAGYTQGVINTSGDSVVAASTPVINTQHLGFVEGIITPSANGVVQLRGASEVNATNITILAGSFVEITVVP